MIYKVSFKPTKTKITEPVLIHGDNTQVYEVTEFSTVFEIIDAKNKTVFLCDFNKIDEVLAVQLQPA